MTTWPSRRTHKTVVERIRRFWGMRAKSDYSSGRTATSASGPYGLPAACQQLAQNVLQNAAVRVVQRLLRRVDAKNGLELFCVWPVLRPNFHSGAGGESLDQGSDSCDLKDFVPGQRKRFGALSGQELQGQNSHPNKVGAMNALVAFRNHGMHTEQAWAFGRPITRRT